MARDLAGPVRVLEPELTATEALTTLGSSGLPGVVVRVGSRHVVIPASQILRVALPRYVLDDPALGRVWDEQSADELRSRLVGKRVCDLLAALDQHENAPRPEVDPEATVVEIAAVMAQAHVPLVAVVDEGRLLGVVTANRLIQRLVE